MFAHQKMKFKYKYTYIKVIHIDAAKVKYITTPKHDLKNQIKNMD